MHLIRIRRVNPLDDFHVQLELTSGQIVERDLRPLLTGPIFTAIRENADLFRQVRVESGGLVWPNGADLCPDSVLWGGLPAEDRAPAMIGENRP